MDGSGSDQPTPLPRKKRVGWDHSSAPPSPPNGVAATPTPGRRHAPGEPDANELSRALQILVTDTETAAAAAAAAARGVTCEQPASCGSPGAGATLSPGTPVVRKPVRPVLRRNTSYHSRNNSDDEDDTGTMTPRMLQGNEAAAGAKARADHLAASISRRNSVDTDEDDDSRPAAAAAVPAVRLAIPRPAHLAAGAASSSPLPSAHDDRRHDHNGRHDHGGHPDTAPRQLLKTATRGLGLLAAGEETDTDDAEERKRRAAALALDDPEYARIQNLKASHQEAEKLVKSHSRRGFFNTWAHSGHVSGTSTPLMMVDQGPDEYFPRPTEYHTGILGTLLKLYDGQSGRSTAAGSVSSEPGTPVQSPTISRRSSFASTARSGGAFGQLYSKYAGSTSTLTDLMRSSGMFAAVGGAGGAAEKILDARDAAPGSSSRKSSRKQKEAFKITLHIAGLLSRQRYVVKLCKALMIYGAPTHRLEVFLRNTARVLEISCSFLYIPGCMVICFNDQVTHTSEMRLVREPHGLDLGKLKDVHDIYKHVVHDRISVDDAMVRLEAVMARKPTYPKWVVLLFYGIASVSVGPFGFNARWIDLPIAFLLGIVLGLLSLYAAPANENFVSVFEVAAALATSFLARAFGSIRGGGVFCFSALAQSAIALILPGYMVLCASLELQSQQLVAGSVRMVYALIYTIFLGYGITMGSVVWGAIDHGAVSETTCRGEPMRWEYNFIWVAIFTIALCVINQARARQIPVMCVISIAGWVVNRYAGLYFHNSQISSMFGALVIGLMANIYSRNLHSALKYVERARAKGWFGRVPIVEGMSPDPEEKEAKQLGSPSSDPESGGKPAAAGQSAAASTSQGYGIAAATMLPAIFVQVPSGLAISGSLIAGVSAADQITSGGAAPANSLTVSPAFTVLLGVIQVAIGISVGLFLATLIVYLFGRRPKRGSAFTL